MPAPKLRVEVYMDRADEYRWRAVARNGRVVATRRFDACSNAAN